MRLSVALLTSFWLCSSCAPPPSAPPSAPPVPPIAPSASAQVAEAPWGGEWTLYDPLNHLLPASADELDDLHRESPEVFTVGGRVVWIDLTTVAARKRLKEGRSAVTVSIPDLADTKLLDEVDEAAKRRVVYVSFVGTNMLPDFSPLERLKHVTGLRLLYEAKWAVQPDWSALPDLKRVEILAPHAGDHAFDRLPTNLEALDVMAELSDAAVARIAELPRLKRLNLSWQHRETDVRPLARLSNLETLALGTDVDDQVLAELSTLKQLKSLTIFSSRLTSASVESIKLLPALRELYLPLTKLDAAATAELAKLPLTRLRINPEPGALPALAQSKTLLSLDLYRAKDITDQDLAALVGLPLRELNIQVTQITDAAAPSLAQFSALRSLELEGSLVTGETLRALEGLKHLRHLGVAGRNLKAEDLSALSGFPELRSLRAIPVDAAALRTIARLRELRALRLAWDDQPLDLAPLRGLPNLLIVRLPWSDCEAIAARFEFRCPRRDWNYLGVQAE